MYLSLLLSFSFSLYFCWLGHVFSSLSSNVSMIVLWRCSLNEFVIVFVVVFFGQVMFSHHSHQMSQWSFCEGVLQMYLSLYLSLSLLFLLIRLCFFMTPISCLGCAINLSDLTNVCVAILRVQCTICLIVTTPTNPPLAHCIFNLVSWLVLGSNNRQCSNMAGK